MATYSTNDIPNFVSRSSLNRYLKDTDWASYTTLELDGTSYDKTHFWERVMTCLAPHIQSLRVINYSTKIDKQHILAMTQLKELEFINSTDVCSAFFEQLTEYSASKITTLILTDIELPSESVSYYSSVKYRREAAEMRMLYFSAISWMIHLETLSIRRCGDLATAVDFPPQWQTITTFIMEEDSYVANFNNFAQWLSRMPRVVDVWYSHFTLLDIPRQDERAAMIEAAAVYEMLVWVRNQYRNIQLLEIFYNDDHEYALPNEINPEYVDFNEKLNILVELSGNDVTPLPTDLFYALMFYL